jgi:hypothetical protein
MAMSRVPMCGLLAAVVLGMCGCQCTPGLRDGYGDVIDTINDHTPHFDWLYSPVLDLNMIGHREWCASPINRWLCPGCRKACRGCRHCRASRMMGQTYSAPGEMNYQDEPYQGEEYKPEDMPPVPAPPAYEESEKPAELKLGTPHEMAPLPAP